MGISGDGMPMVGKVVMVVITVVMVMGVKMVVVVV